MVRNGRSVTIGKSLESSPLIEYTFDISKDSSSVRSGRIVESDFANRVFPLHGGPDIMMLCPPDAAISRALFACS